VIEIFIIMIYRKLALLSIMPSNSADTLALLLSNQSTESLEVTIQRHKNFSKAFIPQCAFLWGGGVPPVTKVWRVFELWTEKIAFRYGGYWRACGTNSRGLLTDAGSSA
jgi:hypothetical protein